MKSPPKKLVVSTPQGGAGRLAREAQHVFDYETSDPNCQLGLEMPISSTRYVSSLLHPLFAQNLPEGFLLKRLTEQLSASGRKATDMQLLAEVGERQIGRLTIHQDGAEQRASTLVDFDELLHSNSTTLFEDLVETHMHCGIAGVQPKVMVSTRQPGAQPALTLEAIVKASGEHPFLSENEYLCMTAAKRAGLLVPDFWISDDGALFIIQRFDVGEHSNLGFEDMATLDSRTRDASGAYKYQSSYEQVAKLVAKHCADIESRHRLFDYVVLSVLVRNGDAHLKNFGLLYEDPARTETIRLSPLFDVVTTSIYPVRTPNGVSGDFTLALNLRGSKAYPTAAHLAEFGQLHCHVEKPLEVIERVAQAIRETLVQESSRFGGHPKFAELCKAWESGLRVSAR